MVTWLHPSSTLALLLTHLLFFQLCRPTYQFSVSLEKKSPSLTPTATTTSKVFDQQQHQLSGSWTKAKQTLRNPSSCVVSISGLDQHLSTLQSYFCGEDAPSDIDLRMRIRCTGGNNSGDDGDFMEVVYADCKNIYDTIMDPHPPRASTIWRNSNTMNDTPVEQHNNNDNDNNNLCIQALQELALGIHSLADNNNNITDVHMRIVCASSYNAIDPPFHTDKCPLRGYVTLCGPGTEYMIETCTPWEYVALRTFGVKDGLERLNREKVEKSLRMAKELEFIVMKGDYYDDIVTEEEVMGLGSKEKKKKLWSRSDACVHRSPRGSNGKRVILSLDLADGGDDQEWEERGRKRNWRVGMTQRKSHLVS